MVLFDDLFGFFTADRRRRFEPALPGHLSGEPRRAAIVAVTDVVDARRSCRRHCGLAATDQIVDVNAVAGIRFGLADIGGAGDTPAGIDRRAGFLEGVHAAGLSVEEVCDWYLAVYVDAFEWVELPNTLGMALHADGGLMASKPYAGSGKYVQRQGDHCAGCRYSPARMTGEGACPFNSLYWRFMDLHRELLLQNPRVAMIYRSWDRQPAARPRRWPPGGSPSAGTSRSAFCATPRPGSSTAPSSSISLASCRL